MPRKDFFELHLLFLATAFIVLLLSPQNPFGTGVMLTDSGVFQTIAMMMENGFMPYRDSFDHKGPLLYVINFFGRLIDTDHGIWFLEFISLYVLIIISYKIAGLTNNSYFVKLITILFALFFLEGRFVDGGNNTEEFAMPFIAGGIYIFLDYLINKNISKYRIAICGGAFACVLMLKVNMVSVWLVFCLYISAKCIIEKNWGNLFHYIVWFLVGIVFVVLPIFLWLSFNGAFIDFLNCYILFNLKYSTGSLHSLFDTLFVQGYSAVFLISLIVSLLFSLQKGKNKALFIVYSFYLLVSLFLASMSRRIYGHYALVLVPSVVFPMSCFFGIFLEKRGFGRGLLVMFSAAVLFFLGSLYIYTDSRIDKWLNDSMKEWSHRVPLPYFETEDDLEREMSIVIDKYTSKENKISVYGSLNSIYVLSNRIHATKYSYQMPIGYIEPKIIDEYFFSLEQELPTLIVLSAQMSRDVRMREFLARHEYTNIYSKGHEIFVLFPKVPQSSLDNRL